MTHLSVVPVHSVRIAGVPPLSAQTRHREVMSLFESVKGSRPRESMGILYRYEQPAGRAPYYLIRSKVPMEFMPEGAQARLEEVSVPSGGEIVRFRIAVNGVVRSAKGGIRPARFDDQEGNAVEGTPTMTDWLKKRLDGALYEVTITNHIREVLGADRRGIISKSERVVQVDTIDGVARVDNPELLKEKLVKGVGRAKSYGCGLLTVARV